MIAGVGLGRLRSAPLDSGHLRFEKSAAYTVQHGSSEWRSVRGFWEHKRRSNSELRFHHFPKDNKRYVKLLHYIYIKFT